MTSYKIIYDAFLAKIEEDKWCDDITEYISTLADWESLLEAAISWFKFPRVSLARTGSSYDDNCDIIKIGEFEADLNNQEIQIIATLMKWMWLDRTINSWENVKVMYDEKDFSQGNLLNNFIKLLDKTEKQCYRLQKLYSRSREDEFGERKPYQFSKLAGKNNGI